MQIQLHDPENSSFTVRCLVFIKYLDVSFAIILKYCCFLLKLNIKVMLVAVKNRSLYKHNNHAVSLKHHH